MTNFSTKSRGACYDAHLFDQKKNTHTHKSRGVLHWVWESMERWPDFFTQEFGVRIICEWVLYVGDFSTFSGGYQGVRGGDVGPSPFS